MKTTANKGFVLLEVLMAIALFGMAGLGLAKALNYSALAAVESQLDLRMMTRLQSALTLASKSRQMEEYKVVSDPDDLGVLSAGSNMISGSNNFVVAHNYCPDHWIRARRTNRVFGEVQRAAHEIFWCRHVASTQSGR